MDNINFAKLTPAQSATLARIRHALATNPKAVERAVLVVYANQTQDEKRDSDTKHNNLKGFNAADASRLSYYSRWINSGRSLTGNHLERARKVVGKYWRQLLVAALKKAESAPKPAHSTVQPPPGSWAETARMMASFAPEFDWDAWKDEMKEQSY